MQKKWEKVWDREETELDRESKNLKIWKLSFIKQTMDAEGHGHPLPWNEGA